MKRSGPVERDIAKLRAWRRRSKRPRPRNPERRARLYKRNFGDYADAIREMPCLICNLPGPSDPHHVQARGMGGCGGDRRSLAPLCRYHHNRVHDLGRETFDHIYGTDLAAEADRLWQENGGSE